MVQKSSGISVVLLIVGAAARKIEDVSLHRHGEEVSKDNRGVMTGVTGLLVMLLLRGGVMGEGVAVGVTFLEAV
jgi:hypothetical protein